MKKLILPLGTSILALTFSACSTTQEPTTQSNGDIVIVEEKEEDKNLWEKMTDERERRVAEGQYMGFPSKEAYYRHQRMKTMRTTH